METIHTEQETPQTTPSETSQPTDHSAGFAAAFNRVRGGSEPVIEKTVTETPVEPAQPQATEPPPPALIAGLTEEEIRNGIKRVSDLEGNLRKMTDDFNGRYGRLKQVIDGIQSQTPAGEPVELTVEDLASLKEEYPELAGLVARDLNVALKKAGRVGTAPPSQGIDQETLDRLVQERVGGIANQLQTQFDQKLAVAFMDIRHPDRVQIAASDDYKDWIKTKPAEYAQTLETTWDVTVLSEGLDDFKAWREERAKSKKRLENAVQPTKGATTAPPAAPNPSAAFAKGFHRARGSA